MEGISRKIVGDIMGTIARRLVTLTTAIGTSDDKVKSQEFLDSARKRQEDFTRNRKMPFVELVYFMLNMVKSSTQTCLDHFFELIGREDVHMSQQSYSEARQKIKWEAFQDLFATIVDHIYTGYYNTWHGYRVSAIDGSKLQLPDDPKLRDYFGTTGKGGTAATAQASALYDVYNNVLMDVQIEPIGTGERELALRHLAKLHSLPSFDKELVLYDRGYASFDMVGNSIGKGIHFVMRVKRGFNKDIDLLGEGANHMVTLRKEGHESINVRVIKFALPSGEEETLITDIFDKRMGVQAFKELYFQRWPIETKYDEIKNKLEVENFSGRTVDAIRQDFYVTMYLSNMMAIARWDAQEKLDASREDKDNKYDYHVNASHSVGVLKDRFIRACLSPDPSVRSREVRRILFLLEAHPTPTRPGRSIPRNPIPRKAKFRHNRKSNC